MNWFFICFSLLLVIDFHSPGFSKADTNSLKYQQSKKDYYLFINTAEQNIIEKNYKKAQHNYLSAFQCSHPGFADDYNNALKIASMVGDTSLAFYASKKLLERGMCLEFFQNFPLLLHDSLKWAKQVKDAHPGASKVNLEYRRTLFQMLNEDQDVRMDRVPDKVSKADSLNFVKFKRLVNTFGYPSEELIGIECSDNLQGIKSQPQDLMLLHFSLRQYAGLDGILCQALSDNQISPYEYASFMSNLNSDTLYFTSPVAEIKDEYYTFRFSSDSSKARINSYRAEIGLPPVEDQVKIILATIKNGKNGFRFFAPIDRLPDDIPQRVIDKYYSKIQLE